MGKSFADYQAEHTKEPFPVPMPDGTAIEMPLPTIDQEKAMTQAAAAAREAGEWTPFSGLEVLVGAGDAASIAAAWGAGDGSAEAWNALMDDMREHFGRKN